MPTSLRKTLIDSHVAAIAIAALLAFSLGGAALLCFPRFPHCVIPHGAIATNDIPYVPRTLDFVTHQLSLQDTLLSLFRRLSNLAAAWFVSRWFYGTGL